MRRLLARTNSDNHVDEETIHETVLEDAKETFWESAYEDLEQVASAVGKNVPESQNRVNQAAREIYEHSEQAHVEWRLPAAVVTGLPGGLSVALNYDDPESIGRVIRAINSPAE